MSAKKTAAKKAVKKRVTKKKVALEKGNLVQESKPSGVKKAAKKIAKKKVAQQIVASETVSDSGNDSTVSEPKQRVRDLRTSTTPETDGTLVAKNAIEQDSLTHDDVENSHKNRHRRVRKSRHKNEHSSIAIDHQEWSNKAWKIFLGEINEDGLALIGDKEAKELAKKSFRIAAFFLEEQGRKLGVKSQVQQHHPVEEGKESTDLS